MKKTLIVLVILSFCLNSCTSQNKDQKAATENKAPEIDPWIGHWKITQNKVNELKEFRIIKDGENYIFQAIGHDFYLGRDYKAVLKKENSNLVLTGVPMMGNVDLALIDSEQSLLFKGGTFKKILE